MESTESGWEQELQEQQQEIENLRNSLHLAQSPDGAGAHTVGADVDGEAMRWRQKFEEERVRSTKLEVQVVRLKKEVEGITKENNDLLDLFEVTRTSALFCATSGQSHLLIQTTERSLEAELAAKTEEVAKLRRTPVPTVQ